MARRIFALTLALALALCCAASAEVVENPNFVFDDLPLTEEPIEASVVIARHYNSGEPEVLEVCGGIYGHPFPGGADRRRRAV